MYSQASHNHLALQPRLMLLTLQIDILSGKAMQTTDAYSDVSSVVDPQAYNNDERKDSSIGTPPTEGYHVFDARPTVVSPSDSVSRLRSFDVLRILLRNTRGTRHKSRIVHVHSHPLFRRQQTLTNHQDFDSSREVLDQTLESYYAGLRASWSCCSVHRLE